MEKKSFALSKALYFLSGLLVLQFLFSVYTGVVNVKSWIGAGEIELIADFNIIWNYFMDVCFQYFFYAIVLFVLGWLMHKIIPSSFEVIIDENAPEDIFVGDNESFFREPGDDNSAEDDVEAENPEE